MDFDWLEDLKRDRHTAETERNHAGTADATWRIDVCAGRNCSRAGSAQLHRLLLQLLDENELTADVEVHIVGCRDRCDFAPSWDIHPGPTRYCRLSPAAVRQIVTQHLEGHQPLESHVYDVVTRRRVS